MNNNKIYLKKMIIMLLKIQIMAINLIENNHRMLLIELMHRLIIFQNKFLQKKNLIKNNNNNVIINIRMIFEKYLKQIIK